MISRPPTRTLIFRHALLPTGWSRNVHIELGDDGRIASVAAGGTPSADFTADIAVPGLANLHSHGFQRALAGLTEHRAVGSRDSFWSWRELMYRFVARMSPEDIHAVTALAYAEMLESGFTSVGEFHYLHHGRDGSPYSNPATTLEAVNCAAHETGIGQTLLPVFYHYADFGDAPASPAQARFICTLQQYADLLARADQLAAARPGDTAGMAPHSLRAVAPGQLSELLAARHSGPVHIHIAEQVREVVDCQAALGARPVEWLLANAPVNERWCLVHATHISDSEAQGVLAHNATVGLCPVTEANLGDGVFPASPFLATGGKWGIGSDSHVRIDAAEEMRTLEYSQRQQSQSRNVLAGEGASTGATLFAGALEGGSRALGRRTGKLVGGYDADIVALDGQHPSLAGRSGDALLDSWIFAGGRDCIAAVWSRGRHVVEDGQHRDKAALLGRYRKSLESLLA